ncbi:NAD(P)-dependent oxidoreductase [Luteipulveratus sp. YIM 133132]|uniref:NAD(P)-dependent oxidoreductase n=1 Tax=Luteipulveratus flavus TaxID=3031728 RepID=UPI0023B0E4DB|nr:NAD(P)-dependent oxidoreductase [Luteipulveratus sp. YIM 133132]MDE9365644.1 NAD(P)-dependent oxidoreductase [Luteipulveratus sp. YIM 133132]
MAETKQQVVAVLGTGTMGAGMARSAARAGHDVRVWNRTRSRAESLSSDGIDVAGSVADAVRGADVVVTMLFDTDAVLGVADELVGALGDDAVWVQSSTVGPDGMARIADAASTDRLLDAPMLGTKQPAEQGSLVALVSGPHALVTSATPTLDALTSKVVRAGDALGQASGLKLACNAWIASITAAAAQSVALAEGLGLDARTFLEALDGGASNAPYLQMKGKAMIEGAYEPSFALDGMLKDTGLIRDALARVGLRTDVIDGQRAVFEQASKDGHGDQDMAAVRLAF